MVSQSRHCLQEAEGIIPNAPVLQYTDLARQVMVEMDVSNSGVGAILSQCNSTTHKLHPCAFFTDTSLLLRGITM